jgi:hypothetical protein
MGLFDGVLVALHEASVRYVVVGGVAVVVQGHPRLTADLDLVVDLEERNLLRALGTLESLGLVPRLPVAAASFADPGTRSRWIKERNLTVFSLHDPGRPGREVDLFAEPPLPFEELWDGADVVRLAGVEVRVASIEHLVRMKRAVGRPQDLADVAALEAVAAAREES